MLREFENAKLSADLAANPESRMKGKPQRNIVGDYLQRHHGCTDECREGFASILTDNLWMFFHVGEPDLSVYEMSAKRGLLNSAAPGTLA
jgi:hypothetical protein